MKSALKTLTHYERNLFILLFFAPTQEDLLDEEEEEEAEGKNENKKQV